MRNNPGFYWSRTGTLKRRWMNLRDFEMESAEVQGCKKKEFRTSFALSSMDIQLWSGTHLALCPRWESGYDLTN